MEAGGTWRCWIRGKESDILVLYNYTPKSIHFHFMIFSSQHGLPNLIEVILLHPKFSSTFQPLDSNSSLEGNMKGWFIFFCVGASEFRYVGKNKADFSNFRHLGCLDKQSFLRLWNLTHKNKCRLDNRFWGLSRLGINEKTSVDLTTASGGWAG